MICSMSKLANRSWSPLPGLNRSRRVSPEVQGLLRDVAKNAKLELMRGNDQVVKEFLVVLILGFNSMTLFEDTLMFTVSFLFPLLPQLIRMSSSVPPIATALGEFVPFKTVILNDSSRVN